MSSERARLGSALTATLGSLLYPQVLVVMFLPFFFSIAFVGIGLWLTWSFWMSYFQSGSLALQPYWLWLSAHLPTFLQPVLGALDVMVPWLVLVLLFVLAVPVVIALNLMIVSILASGYLVHFLARRDFPRLEFKGRPRLAQGLVNTFSTMVIYVLGSVLIAVPLIFLPGLAVVVSLGLTGWLNQRICSFDALTDLATNEEMRQIREQNRRRGYILGCISGAFTYLPFGFFMAPVLTMVAFIQFNLRALELLRSQQNPSS